MKKLALIFACSWQLLFAQSDTLLINSKLLGQKILVYIHPGQDTSSKHAILYATDGQKMIEAGMLDRLIDLSAQDSIPSPTYVFVSTIDPKNHNKDYRNEYFFCNEHYLSFFEQELIPQVESHLGISYSPSDRALLGVSFGGLNAAYFSAKSPLFKRYALLSPITYPCPLLTETIALSTYQDLQIFLSTGTVDAESYVSPLELLYRAKGYKVRVLQTAGGHTVENWNGQLQEVLSFFWN